MITRIVIVIAITAALWQPSKAQTQQSDEIVWLKYGQDIGLGDIINAVFTPDDQSILVTDANFKLIEIDAVTGEVKKEIPNIRGAIQFSDDGQYLYAYGFEKVKYPSGELVGKFTIPAGGFSDIIDDNYNAGFCINEKAGLLIGAFYQADHSPWLWKKNLWVYNLNTFQLIDTIGIDKNYYYSIQITDDGKYFITGSKYDPIPEETSDDDDVNMLWDAKTLKTIRECPELGNIKTSPDGKWLGSVGANIVNVFDANTLKKVYEWEQGTGCCLNSIDISYDSKYMVTGGGGISKLHIWNLLNGSLEYIYKTDGENVTFSNLSQKMVIYSINAIAIMNNMITSVSDNSSLSLSVLYPNPTTGDLIIRSANLIAGNLYIYISSITGSIVKIIYDGMYDGTELTFNVSDIAAGTYILKAVQNNKTYTYKVVKEN